MNGLAICAGVGGLELGVEAAVRDYRTVCYIEREAYAAAVLMARMEDKSLGAAPIWCGDVGAFDSRAFADKVDIITAGFPCQPFSAAGRRLGQRDERWLWPQVRQVLEDTRARYLFIENVPGLIRRGLVAVLSDLNHMGFDAEWGVFSAAQVGAPHIRKRLFLLAYPSGTGLQGSEWSSPHEEGTTTQGPAAQRSGVVLAHTHGLELRKEQGRGEEGGAGAPQPADTGEDMADPDSGGQPCERGPHCNCTGWEPVALRCQPDRPGPVLWPPGPDTYPDEWPAAVPQPAVRRGSDGLAYRVDRLRCTGNGVAPLQAAVALRTLVARVKKGAGTGPAPK